MPGRSCWNSGARSARRAWRSSRRGPRFPPRFQSVLVSFKQGFRLFLWIVLVCLSKNSTRGLIQGIEGGMIIKIGTDLETRQDFGSSVIIRRKVYIVTLMVVLERSCRLRWAVLHNPMKHVFFGKLEQCSQYPLENDHISLTVNGTFESMIFFIRWDMLVSRRVVCLGPWKLFFFSNGWEPDWIICCLHFSIWN